jgi:methionyl-tRNA synthetase
MPKFFLTTPIYYPNARPHVGSAYTTIVCDVIARYKRMCGYDVAFLTGTDEHGEKLQRAAESAGMLPGEFVAEKRELFKDLWRALGISEYRFVHTSQNPAHRAAVQWMIRQANKAGYIEKKKYEGRYCVPDERYISDGAEPANCDVCGRPAELISEENYFFKLSEFQEPLLAHYAEHPEFVQPDYRRNEVVSFVRSGLRDISVSRKRIKWGIPWPGDDEQVVYVWYDALTSYLTGIGFEGDRRSEDFDKYWPADVHMIGKDIIRFHAVYWPAFLMAAGLPLPKTIFAHGWIYYEQDKMSKSKGNVVYPEPMVAALDSFGAPGNDALRYYLLREAPFGQDMSFSYEGLIQRYNSDLANGLGNLASRVLAMVQQYFEGSVPQPSPGHVDSSANTLRSVARPNIWAVAGNQEAREPGQYNDLKFSDAAQTIWRLISHVDAYLVQRKPWALAKNPDQKQELADVLYDACEALRVILVLAHPVMPNATAQIWAKMGQKTALGEQQIDCLDWGQLAPGTALGPLVGVFPRLERATTLAKLDEFAEADRNRDKPKEVLKSVQTDKTPEPAPAATSESRTPAPESRVTNPEPSKISIEDFAKVEMRTGEVKAAERVPGANKLLKLMVDIGTEVRQVVAGIAEYYEPEKLVGMKVVLVTNLQPRKLRGVESNGMIVAASVEPEGRPVLVTFKEDVPNGTRLK